MKKVDIFGVNFSVADYNTASDLIIENAKRKKSFAVTALAVHGIVEVLRDIKLNAMLPNIDMILPDGQPVKWVMNNFYRLNLKDRVCGPFLTLHVLGKASTYKMGVFLYGSTENTVKRFSEFINNKYPGVNICGIHIDRFRDATPQEDADDIKKINDSGAHIVFVGRGCPRQEHWVAEHKDKVNAAMIAVGAAFDFHAGNLSMAPSVIQKMGLEWFYRLCQEPKRLWKRYLITNAYFIFKFAKYKLFRKR
jgi:N-acetylglucosaminyldiphosphoundecaprenol N-acetyl-beta-D-mannosaminyltransferase